MSLLTAAGGPLIEIALINGPGLYHYTHPLIYGVPTWIPWVYLCGAPGELCEEVLDEEFLMGGRVA
jgi:hypothetical protein